MTDQIPTLDEFLARGPNKFPRNSYVREKGFESLYVRWGVHMINGELLHCFDVANAAACCPGHGAFKALVKKLRTSIPNWPIYIENVLNEKFLRGLPKLGFVRVADSHPPSFILK